MSDQSSVDTSLSEQPSHDVAMAAIAQVERDLAAFRLAREHHVQETAGLAERTAHLAGAEADLQARAKTMLHESEQFEVRRNELIEREEALAAAAVKVHALQEACTQARHDLRQAGERLAAIAELVDAPNQSVADQDAITRHEKHLAEVARHLQRRKTRLAALRSARSAKAEPPALSSPVAAARRSVRLGSLIGSAVLALLVLGLSYTLQPFVFDVPGVATVSLRATDRVGNAVSPAENSAFIAWHQALLGTPSFVEHVAERLDRRGLLSNGGIDRVASMLAQDIVIEDNGAGNVSLLFASENVRRAVSVLDVVTLAMVGASSRQAPGMDGEWRLTLESDKAARESFSQPVPRSLDFVFLGHLLIVALGVCVGLVGTAWIVQSVWFRAVGISRASENLPRAID